MEKVYFDHQPLPINWPSIIGSSPVLFCSKRIKTPSGLWFKILLILSKDSFFISCLPIQSDEEPKIIYRYAFRWFNSLFSAFLDSRLALTIFRGREALQPHQLKER